METSRLLLLLVMYCSCSSWPVWARTSMELNSFLTPGADPLFSSDPASNPPAFMLSFRSPSSSSSKLYLCISFVVNVSMPGQCVWTANRDAPVTPSASLKLTSSGNLELSDSSVASSSDIWNSTTSGLNVVRVLLLNSGNLVLVNSTSDYVWQSFLYPTDTLLPGQDFTPQSTQLVSNSRTDDFSSGRYLFRFDSISQLTLQLRNSSPSYWNWGQIGSFRFDELGNVTLFNSPSSINATYATNDIGVNAIRRMTLDMDGNLRMYTWDAASAQWIIVWMAFTDVCTRLKGLCGSYGVCVYDNMQPTCMCPQGFSVVDATDLLGGCKRNYDLDDCNSIKYVEFENIDYPLNDISATASLSIDECKKSCSSNCNCMAAVYWQSQNYGTCWLKNIVQNGYSPGSQQHRVFLKISASDPLVSNPVMNIPTKWSFRYVWQPSIATGSNQSSPNQLTPSQSSTKYLSAVIALTVAIAIVALCFAGMLRRYRRQLKYMKLQYGELEGSPLVFSYEELRMATQSFSHKLGAGGFGTVYRGQLQNGKVVAVKQLEGISQQEKQFRAEIVTIGRIHHINLLPLVGFCSEGAHRLLVYEYMEIGSLDQVLFAEHQQTQALDWRRRFQICLGVARGIHYLHEECLDFILHCDIKPQNILLDGSFSAKVADFGLAYLYRRDHTVKMSTIRGTRGYLAPEWVSNSPITSKADVYSYGMLIMEIVSGRSNYLYTESAMADANERWCFPTWAYGKRVEDVVDTRLDQPSTDMRQVEAVLKVGYACIQSDMNARPSMGNVVQMLEGTLPIPDAPPASLFSQGQYPASAGSASWQALSAR